MARKVWRRGAVAVLSVLPGLVAGPALAQNVHISRLYEQVLENIEFAEAAHVLDTFGVFRLNEGGTVRLEIDVPAEASVQVMGDCDEDCIDLDLTIYDADGEMLGEDRLPDFYPIVDFMSGTNGRVTIELDMVDCDAAYCYTAYSVFINAAP